MFPDFGEVTLCRCSMGLSHWSHMLQIAPYVGYMSLSILV